MDGVAPKGKRHFLANVGVFYNVGTVVIVCTRVTSYWKLVLWRVPQILSVCAYVRTSVPKKFFDFSEIWHVGRGR